MIDRRTANWMLVGLFVLSLPAVTVRIYASDEAQYFAYLRSLWFDHDVSFENEYRHFYDGGTTPSEGFRETFLERETETGRRINFGTIGCAILWAPFYGVADLYVRWMAGGRIPADGFGAPYIAAVAYGSACYGLFALLISTGIARWLFADPTQAVTAALLTWLGTPLLFYMYVAPPMSHACSAFAVASFLAIWLAVRRRWSAPGLIVLGAAAALMAMVREQDAFFVVGPVLDFGRTWWLAGQDQAGGSSLSIRVGLLGRALAGTVSGALVYAPQALAYQTLNGYVGPSRLVARKMTWSAPHFWEVLFSPAHGFLIWTPLAIIALCGLVATILRRSPQIPAEVRWVVFCLLVMFLVQVYIAGSVESWTVAGAFGQRRFVAVTPILVVGLTAAIVLVRAARWRWIGGTVVACCVWWNLGLTVQFGAHLMDRQRLEPLRNAYVNFVVLPRALPGLVTRYLFARDTFYRTPEH